MKKRVFAVLMASVTAAGLLAGCGGGNDGGSGQSENGDRDSLKMLKKEKSSIFTAGTMNSAPAWRLCTRKLRAHLMMER